MSTISSVGSAGSAWSDLGGTRATARKERMFAKADANGDGTVDKTELQSMLDDISSKTSQSLGSADDLLSKMDSDGSGSLSKDELADGMKSLMPPPSSTMDFAQQRSVDGQMPPPPPPPDDAVSSSSSSTSATATDPADTNGDGVVSATELAASQFKELITNLSSALDGSGTSSLTASQGDAFKSQFDSMIATLESAGSSSGSSSTSSGSTSTDSDGSSSSSQAGGLDLSALAQLVMKEYTQAASNYAQTSSVSVAA